MPVSNVVVPTHGLLSLESGLVAGYDDGEVLNASQLIEIVQSSEVSDAENVNPEDILADRDLNSANDENVDEDNFDRQEQVVREGLRAVDNISENFGRQVSNIVDMQHFFVEPQQLQVNSVDHRFHQVICVCI